jgi:Recombination protein O N terminal.
MTHKTSYIILWKIPFQETGLIVSGFSEEYGRLDFLLKGARGSGAKNSLMRNCSGSLPLNFIRRKPAEKCAE